MKIKTAKSLFFVLASWSLGYFIALEIACPSPWGFGFVWLFLAVFLFISSFKLRKADGSAQFRPFSRLSKKVKIALCTIFALAVCIASVNLFLILTPRIADGSEKISYVFLLGGGITPDGKLDVETKERARTAARYLKAHPEAKVAATGGKQTWQKYAGGPALAAELEKCGINPERIIVESKSFDTIQNFRYSTKLIAADAGISEEEVRKMPVAVVTTRFHLARAEKLAKRQGFTEVYGISSASTPLFILTDYTREILAYVKLSLRILIESAAGQ